MMRLNKLTDLRRGMRVAALIVVLSSAFPAGVAVAQEIPDQEAIQALMAKALELAEPGPEHARFEQMVGTWNMELTMWSQPGAEAVVVGGVVEAELILGGRYLVQTTTILDGFFAGESIIILGFVRRVHAPRPRHHGHILGERTGAGYERTRSRLVGRGF
jgi:hypothetical protein